MKRLFVTLAVLALLPATALAETPKPVGCRMGLIAELPVTFTNNRPIVPMEVDGHSVAALIDTGATSTIIFTDTAHKLGLALHVDPRYRFYGADGEAKASFAHVVLGMMGAKGPAQEIAVIGKAPRGEDMILGEDILSQADLELDLGHGKMRILKPDNCRDEDMAYWAQSYSEAQITEGPDRHIRLTVLLNGARVPAILDTGATVTTATSAAGFKAGAIYRSDEGGEKMRGVNGHALDVIHGTLRTVQIGDEKVGATTILFGQLFSHEEAADTGSRISDNAADEMLLGADFLRSHHVIVDRGRGKMFFTYNGGPVFRSAPDAPPAPKSTPAMEPIPK